MFSKLMVDLVSFNERELARGEKGALPLRLP
jgi:hypothetical protein